MNLKCCYIAFGTQCQEKPTWAALEAGKSGDMETHACDDHLGHILGDGEHSVWTLSNQQDEFTEGEPGSLLTELNEFGALLGKPPIRMRKP